MVEYGSSYGQKNTERKNEPHPDEQQNREYFYRTIENVEWVKTSIGKAYYSISEENLCVFFHWPIFYYGSLNKKWGMVSFHQSHRKSDKDEGFREQLCRSLNYLGSLGFLLHKKHGKVHPSKKRENLVNTKDDKWEAFSPPSYR